MMRNIRKIKAMTEIKKKFVTMRYDIVISPTLPILEVKYQRKLKT